MIQDNAFVIYLNSIGIVLVIIILPEDFNKSLMTFQHKCDDGLFTMDLKLNAFSTKRLQFAISKSMSVASMSSSLPKIISLSPKLKFLEIRYHVTKTIFSPGTIFDKLSNDSLFDIIHLNYHNSKYMLSSLKCKQCGYALCTLPPNSIVHKVKFSLEDNLDLFLCHPKFSALHPNYLNLEKNLRTKVNIDEQYVWIHQYLLEEIAKDPDDSDIVCDHCSMKLGFRDTQANSDFIFRKYDVLKVDMVLTCEGKEVTVNSIFNKEYFHHLLQQCLVDNRHKITFCTKEVVIDIYVKWNIIYTIKSKAIPIEKLKATEDKAKASLSEIRMFNIIEYTFEENNAMSDLKHSIEMVARDKDKLLELFNRNLTENAFEVFSYKRVSNTPEQTKLYFMDLSPE